MIHDLVGWKRWVVGGVALPFRNHKRVLAGVVATDNPANGSTDLALGVTDTLRVAGADYSAPETLGFGGMSATAPDADTVRVALLPAEPMFVRASGAITGAAHADLSAITISDAVGLHILHTWVSGHDHAEPTHVAYYEALFGVVRDALGGLSAPSEGAYGGIALTGPRHGAVGLGYEITPYYTIVGSTGIHFKAYWQGEFGSGVDQIDVTCDARILTFPGP
jgi:hypothetical protein